MHIVIDARIVNSSTGRYVERLIHHLQQIDIENNYTILVPTKDISFLQLTNPHFRLTACDFDNYSFAEQFKFKPFLDSLQPDLVHFCMPQQPLLYRGPRVTTVHDLTLLRVYNSDKNWLLYRAKQLVGRIVFKKIAQCNQFILVPSQYTFNDYQKFSGIADQKLRLTYEASESFDDSMIEYDAPFKKYLLYVGQQSDYKNIVRLAAAHQQLLLRQPDLGLILVGNENAGVLKNKKLFTRRGYKNIHFTGFIPDAQKHWLYKNALVYVFPSLYEGFGLPGLEAMTYGAPVVASSATCLPEIYGEAAHYFDPLSIPSITQSIQDVIDDEVLRRTLVFRGYDQIKHYSWSKMAEQTLQTYKDAIQ